MGKIALLFAFAATTTMLWLTFTANETSEDSDNSQFAAHANQQARDLAIKGRELALASWTESSGQSSTAPFKYFSTDGGIIQIKSYKLTEDILDVTIRAEYSGAVHDLRSQYQWHPGGSLNAFQIKAADVDFYVSNQATLDIPSITVDDQSLTELDDVLVQELGLANNLNELGLGSDNIIKEITNALDVSGKNNINVEVINEADRLQLEKQIGMFFPDQIESAIGSYLGTYPDKETIIEVDESPPSKFGSKKRDEVLRIQGDLVVNQELNGKGILIVEGDLIVPPGTYFKWDGLVIVMPPITNSSPEINLSGKTIINGGLVAQHEAMPNTGHMDVTLFRDYSGNWIDPAGAEFFYLYDFGWDWCMDHWHDFTSMYGNSITFFSSKKDERIHESAIFFYDTLLGLHSNDEIFLEINNSNAHGRASLTIETKTEDRVSTPVAAGFHSSISSSNSTYRTKTFKVKDLKYLHLDVHRLSSLKKMWDTEDYYPNCNSDSGPECVGRSRNRYGTLTLSLYQKHKGADYRIYESSMYWHRRTDELEEFNDKMKNLLSDLQSANYGLNVTIGDNTKLVADVDAIAHLLDGASGTGAGPSLLGAWSAHWSPSHPDNPLSTP